MKLQIIAEISRQNKGVIRHLWYYVKEPVNTKLRFYCFLIVTHIGRRFRVALRYTASTHALESNNINEPWGILIYLKLIINSKGLHQTYIF